MRGDPQPRRGHLVVDKDRAGSEVQCQHRLASVAKTNNTNAMSHGL